MFDSPNLVILTKGQVDQWITLCNKYCFYESSAAMETNSCFLFSVHVCIYCMHQILSQGLIFCEYLWTEFTSAQLSEITFSPPPFGGPNESLFCKGQWSHRLLYSVQQKGHWGTNHPTQKNYTSVYLFNHPPQVCTSSQLLIIPGCSHICIRGGIAQSDTHNNKNPTLIFSSQF